MLSCGETKIISISPQNCDSITDDEYNDILEENDASKLAAGCLLLDIESACQKIDEAWQQFARGEIQLVTATAVTNACVEQAKSMAAATELEFPELSNLEKILAATYFAEAVNALSCSSTKKNMNTDLKELEALQLGLQPNVALSIVQDIAFGYDGYTKINSSALIFAAHLMIDQNFQNETVSAIAKRLSTKNRAEEAKCIVRVVANYILHRFVASVDTENDAWYGSCGLIWTSDFLRRMQAAHMFHAPHKDGTPSILKPDFFGPEWNENVRTALNIRDDLRGYRANFLAGCLYYAYYELVHIPNDDTTPAKRLYPPEFRMPQLVPLWTLLQNAMGLINESNYDHHSKSKARRSGPHLVIDAPREISIGLLVAVHASLLSVVRVNDKEKKSRNLIMIKSKLFFADLSRQLKRDDEALSRLNEEFQHEPYVNNTSQVVNFFYRWVSSVATRLNEDPPPFDYVDMSLVKRQRDECLLLNPYVAGQFVLMACLSLFELGANVIDNLGHTRIILHSYNALRTVNCCSEVQLLETLMESLGTNGPLWHGSKPEKNFIKAWYLVLGMSVDLKKTRKLKPIEPKLLSPAFAAAVHGNLSLSYDRTSHDRSRMYDPLPPALAAIRRAFDTPARENLAFSMNLVAISTHFLSVVERLPSKLGAKINENDGDSDLYGHSKIRSAIYKSLVSCLLGSAEDILFLGTAKKKQGDKADEEIEKRKLHLTRLGETFLNCIVGSDFQPREYRLFTF